MLTKSVFLPVAVLTTIILCGGWLVYEQYYGVQNCEMTWMYAWPQYKRIRLDESIEHDHPQYSLHYYLESRREVEPDLDSWKLKLNGSPVLFIPGNAGSHKQSRSSASIALKMHKAEFSSLSHFDFFTVNINEELSGMFGGVLQRQTTYVAKCIKHILSLYSAEDSPSTSLAIIGHSMGGLVAQALYTLPESEFNKSSVTIIIALASPLKKPVLAFDHLIQQFYDKIHQEWSRSESDGTHVTLVSVAGGERDIMIPTHLTVVPQAISVATPAVPRNWVSADHQAVVWCRRVQLALSRVLFHLLDDGSRELTKNRERREKVARHFLETGREIPSLSEKTTTVIFNSKKMEFVERSSRFFYREGYKSGVSHFAIPLDHQGNRTHLISSNTGKRSWVHICSVVGENANCTDISTKASLLPPKVAVAKYVLLSPAQAEQLFTDASHVVFSQPRDMKYTIKGFMLFEQCDDMEIQAYLKWQGTFITVPNGHCTLLNFSLPDLTEVWQSYTAVIVSSCGGVHAGLVTPWYPHTSLNNSPFGQRNITIQLSVLVPVPHNVTPYLLVWSNNSCPLEVSITIDPLASARRLAVLYAPLLLPWVTAVCIAGSSRQLEFEALFVYFIYTLSRTGRSIGTDWEVWSEERLWCAWVPVIIHLIARGLQQSLFGVTYLFVRSVQWCLGRLLRPISLVLLLASVPCSLVCSGLGLLCLLLGFLFQVSSHHAIEVACVLVCLQFLVTPTLLSWVKGLRYSIFLFPDPHFAAVLAIICVVISVVYTHSQTRSTSRWSLSTEQASSSSLMRVLGLLLLLFGISHAYRMVHFALVYLILTAIKTIVN